MKLSDILASLGVIILLIAFLLNLYKKLDANSRAYTFMNFFGAALCCISSILIRFYPFIILEAVWASFALVSLFKVPRGTSSDKK
ncbi:CBU_0592 family membrane protein [Mucilaginibacter straminoryzae]|uniref:CBU_0592 family membrane protein n=1 Tax=Mucilaginibacter straminoryzae TaxID=2932774 RepID=UPI003B849960